MSDPYHRDAELEEFGALTDPADPAWVAEAAHKAASLGGEDDDIELPPDRVRFSAPLVVEAPDVDEPCDGVVVNLSATGLACVLPLPLHPGERVACRFRPALGEAHIELEADVVWRRRAGGEDSLYGLCFVDVPEAAGERLDALVSERSEGRAGEWPLPVAPAAETAAPVRKRSNAYVAATLGVAAGAVLSLGLSILPDMLLGGSSRPLLPSRALASSADPASLRTPAPVKPEAARPAPASKPEPARQGLTSAAPAAPTASTFTAGAASLAPTPAPVTKAAEPKAAEPKAASTSPVAALDFTGAKVSLDPEPDAKRVDSKATKVPHAAVRPATGHKPEVTQTAHEGEVTLHVDRSAASFKSFWLDDPRRLVVDVPGAHSTVDAGEQSLAGPLATRLRIGEHGDKVRFVLETAAGVTAEVKASVSGSALVVKLSRH